MRAVHGQGGAILLRIAHEGAPIESRGTSVGRRNAAVNGARVDEVLHASAQHRVAGVQGHRGTDAALFVRHEVAIGAALLVQRIHARRELRRKALSDIDGHATFVVRTGLQATTPRGRPLSLLHDAVDHATTAAPTEGERVGALERFDLQHVVAVAEILRVIANPVHEEVGGGALASDRWRIAVSFPLPHRHARHVFHGAGHRLQPEIAQDLGPEHRDGLWYLTQRRQRAGGGARLGDPVLRARGPVGRHAYRQERLCCGRIRRGAGGAGGILDEGSGSDDGGEKEHERHDIFVENASHEALS